MLIVILDYTGPDDPLFVITIFFKLYIEAVTVIAVERGQTSAIAGIVSRNPHPPFSTICGCGHEAYVNRAPDNSVPRVMEFTYNIRSDPASIMRRFLIGRRSACLYCCRGWHCSRQRRGCIFMAAWRICMFCELFVSKCLHNGEYRMLRFGARPWAKCPTESYAN